MKPRSLGGRTLTDSYTRVVLGVVALCLLLLVLQGFGLGAEPPEVPAVSSDNRFRVTALPRTQSLIRFDGRTGDTWRSPLRDDAMEWQFIEERREVPVEETEEELVEETDDAESDLAEEASSLRREVENAQEPVED
jgi:hypothetical protein